jgi:hypothetical protein
MPPTKEGLDFLEVFIPYAGWRLGRNPEPDLAELTARFSAFLESVGGRRDEPRFRDFVSDMRTMIRSGDVKTRNPG